MSTWPVVRRFSGADLTHVAMPVGGIGTGSISLGGRGQLIDWEIFNRPAKGYNPDTFFCVFAEGPSGSVARALELQLLESEYGGPSGSRSPVHGLPRFRDGAFAAAYPLGQVTMSDDDVPVSATVEVFNPLVPGDADASGLPAAVYRVTLQNVSAEPCSVSIAGNLQNVVGREAGSNLPAGNSFQRADVGGATVLLGRSSQVPQEHEAWGTLALAVLDDAVSSARLNWAERSWRDSLLEFWEDFASDGALEEPEQGARVPTGSLVVSKDLAPGASATVTFVIAWHFPNRRGWTHRFEAPPRFVDSEFIVGNHYATIFADAADVVRHVAERLPDLERRTVDYVETITRSDLPLAVQDAVLSNTAVLKSTTCFRIADGTLLGWEGSNPDGGSCHGSCNHVWSYQYALEQLFPDLAWTMRRVELLHALDSTGLMSFRVGLPLETQGTGWRIAAADGQMGALMRLHRTWQLTGRTDLLRELWPAARRAMEFAWIPAGWDGDRDGVMEGCQHNTMDVEYYGPSGVHQSWYLGALAACAELANAVDDPEFAAACQGLLERGAAWTDRELFNGSYYEQQVMPPGNAVRIAEGLRLRYPEDNNQNRGSDDLANPDLQLGSGCASDQLVGHAMALLGGLDDGLDADHVRTALRSVATHNHRDEFHSHFNHMRSYALGADHGLINASYPRGDRPTRPFPYFNEVWTGLEYSAAIGLALEGEHQLAEHVVADVRDRYQGRSRNPFNEVECGNHYVRSMASFGLAHAWSRLVVDVGASSLTVDPVVGRWPVVAGERVGQVMVTPTPDGLQAHYEAVSGDGFESVTIRARSESESRPA